MFTDKVTKFIQKEKIKTLVDLWVFGKNTQKQRNIKLVHNDKRRNYLVSETNFYKKLFFEKLIVLKMRKMYVKTIRPVHL